MKLYRKLECLAYRFRYEATYLEMKYYLKQVIKGKKKEYFKMICHEDRNIGKSCALARLSVKYNIPIVVSTHMWSNLYIHVVPRYIPKYFKKMSPQIIIANEKSRGKRFDLLLIEEGISKEVIDNIIKPMVKKGVVGYKNI